MMSLPREGDIVGAATNQRTVDAERCSGDGSGQASATITLGGDADKGDGLRVERARVGARYTALVGAQRIGRIQRAIERDTRGAGHGFRIKDDDLVLQLATRAAVALRERLQVSAVAVFDVARLALVVA